MAAALHKRVVFCDLDGTLVLDNSFHVFLVTAWAEGSLGQRISLGLRFLARSAGRLSGGHAGLKKRVLIWFSRQPQAWQDSVVQATLCRLNATLSQPVLAALDAYRASGAQIVLATAAPDVYARALVEQIGATDCLATPFPAGRDWQELLAGRKAAACSAWLGPQASYVIALTDHIDDLALLRLADEAVIVGPSTEVSAFQKLLASESVILHHIDTDTDQTNGGYWLWFDDRPSGPHDHWEIRTILSKHRYARIYQGNGQWRRIGPGMALMPAVQRRDCPRPPTSRQRLLIQINRRVRRDWLRIFH